MGARGPAPKLRVVAEREGNPGKRPLPEGVRLPPAVPREPAWAQLVPVRGGKFTQERAAAMRVRQTCREKWALWSRELGVQGILSSIDDAYLTAACVEWAWYVECSRAMALSRERRVMALEASKHLADFYAAARQIGLSPRARDELNARGGAGDGSGGYE